MKVAHVSVSYNSLFTMTEYYDTSNSRIQKTRKFFQTPPEAVLWCDLNSYTIVDQVMNMMAETMPNDLFDKWFNDNLEECKQRIEFYKKRYLLC